jgi:hypothetical protein
MGTKLLQFISASLILLAIAAAAMSPALSARAKGEASAQAKARAETRVFQGTMRTLWEEHVGFTRGVIVSTFDNLPDADKHAQKLLQNQVDIGEAIKPFYGDAAGEKLTELLRQHILIEAEIVQAAEDRDQPGAADAVQRWYANTDEIAAFLNTANPENWPRGETTAMLREHLALTLQQALAQLNGDADGSIAAYEEGRLHALELADMLSNGIITQFPEMFRGR